MAISLNFKRKYIQRPVAVFLAFFLLGIMLCSAYYLAAEAGHACHEEDCPICACRQLCENMLHRSSAAGTMVSFWMILAIGILSVILLPIQMEGSRTLVSQKIRLNN